MNEHIEMIRKICDSQKHANPLRDIMLECQRGLSTDHIVITGPGFTPNSSLPQLGHAPRRKMLIEIEVPENFEKCLDNQWVVEQEIHADRYNWRWSESA